MSKDEEEAGIWLRQEKETLKAFGAFQIYRDLGPDKRSFATVCDELKRPVGYKRQVETWSQQWSWVDRVTAWDDHFDRVKRDHFRERIEEMAERHAKVAMELIELVGYKLSATKQSIAQQLKDNPDGRFEVHGLSFGSMASLLQVASGLERMSLGEAATLVEVKVREATTIPKEYSEAVHKAMMAAMKEEGTMPGDWSEDL